MQRIPFTFAQAWNVLPTGNAADVLQAAGLTVRSAGLPVWNSLQNNSCVVRMSHVLNTCGCLIKPKPGKFYTLTGVHGWHYLIRVEEIHRWLLQEFGSPQLSSRAPADFVGHRGIVVCRWSSKLSADGGQGHVDLLDGTPSIDFNTRYVPGTTTPLPVCLSNQTFAIDDRWCRSEGACLWPLR